MIVDPCFQLLTPNNPMSETQWLQRANQLQNAGVTHLLVAPKHPAEVMFPERMQALTQMYQEMLDRRGISLVIYPGQTVFLDSEATAGTFENQMLYADLNQRYLLVEAPTDITETELLHRLFEPLQHNVIPLLVNPERLTVVDDQGIADLRDHGVRLMVSGQSLLDKQQTKRLMRWLKDDWVDTVGSVSGEKVLIDYRQVLQWLDRHVGRSYRDDLLFNNKALLNGDPFITNHHLKARRRFFGKF